MGEERPRPTLRSADRLSEAQRVRLAVWARLMRPCEADRLEIQRLRAEIRKRRGLRK